MTMMRIYNYYSEQRPCTVCMLDIDSIKCVEVTLSNGWPENTLDVTIYFDLGASEKYSFTVFLQAGLIVEHSTEHEFVTNVCRVIHDRLKDKEPAIDLPSIVANALSKTFDYPLDYRKIFRKHPLKEN